MFRNFLFEGSGDLIYEEHLFEIKSRLCIYLLEIKVYPIIYPFPWIQRLNNEL